MAASMCRMSGPRMAGALLLCALMLSNEVTCENGTDANTTTTATKVATTSLTAGGNAAAASTPLTVKESTPLTVKESTPQTVKESAQLADTVTSAVSESALVPMQQMDENKTDTLTSSGSPVFWGVLVSGLLAALGIALSCLKCQRRTDTKGVRLAEESYPVEQDNQGNTLVSVAPLNPVPETPEKPSVNGEAPEADKTEPPPPPPPTNGHSTTKTADTEM